MTTPDISQLIEQLKSVAASPPQDEKLRKQLYNAAQGLSLAVESPYDTIYRVIYSPQVLSTAHTASNMKIFTTLIKNGGPTTAAELAGPTGADPTFTARIARYLSSHGFISEVGEDTYQANHLTETLSIEGFRAGMNQAFQGIAPCFQVAPKFWAEKKYANPTNVVDTPFQVAFKTELPAFLWLQGNAELVADFGLWMTAVHNGQKTWLDVVDFESLVQGSDAETPVFVDIGGGIGSQCAILKAKFPNLPGRVILQDLPVVVEQYALPTEGVEKTAFDFWGEQPVKGAKTYYMRNILHDYPDEKALTILKNTVAAMGPDSVILIDEMIIPDKGAHPHATEQDMVMMTTLSSMERTQKQWDALLAAAGLKAVKKSTYLEDTGDSLQTVVRQ
ncbi:putative O-methyltransferase domain-containing protein [Seiridium unicorne]|uniref:O-methyltransferase domain-containing protein n=1 Tax=Seiridium unicorne TaxID=138068 RepID=A0ABR2V9T6_9PEZI